MIKFGRTEIKGNYVTETSDTYKSLVANFKVKTRSEHQNINGKIEVLKLLSKYIFHRYELEWVSWVKAEMLFS
jgi:hypothetical protein